MRKTGLSGLACFRLPPLLRPQFPRAAPSWDTESQSMCPGGAASPTIGFLVIHSRRRSSPEVRTEPAMQRDSRTASAKDARGRNGTQRVVANPASASRLRRSAPVFRFQCALANRRGSVLGRPSPFGSVRAGGERALWRHADELARLMPASRGAEWLRWAGCFALVVAGHGLAVMALLNPTEEFYFGIDVPVVTVDLPRRSPYAEHRTTAGFAARSRGGGGKPGDAGAKGGHQAARAGIRIGAADAATARASAAFRGETGHSACRRDARRRNR